MLDTWIICGDCMAVIAKERRATHLSPVIRWLLLEPASFALARTTSVETVLES